MTNEDILLFIAQIKAEASGKINAGLFWSDPAIPNYDGAIYACDVITAFINGKIPLMAAHGK